MTKISDEANHSNRLRLERLQTYCTLHVCNVVVNQAISTKQDAKILDNARRSTNLFSYTILKFLKILHQYCHLQSLAADAL